MTIYIDDDLVRELLTYRDCIAILDKLFKDEAGGLTESFPSVNLNVPNGFLRIKAGGAYGFNAYGLKAYGLVFDELPVRFLVNLYNTKDGGLDALVEGQELSVIRTGAVSALACRYMARTDATILGVIGTGREALGQVAAIKEVRNITKVICSSRSEENRRQFAAQIESILGIESNPEESAKAAVEAADIVVTATSSSQPVLMGQWLKPGQHVCAIGATQLYRREIDVDVVKRASKIVVENKEQARQEIGELIFAQHQRSLNWAEVIELKQIAAGTVRARNSDDDITLVSTAGVGAEDVAVAAFVHSQARERKLGEKLPF